MFFATVLNGQTYNLNYDSTLAKSLNADDFGMKKYVLVLLKKGTNTAIDKSTKDSLLAGHMKNINRLAENGSLVVAGPMGKNDSYVGIFILNVETYDEAKQILETDPTIKEKYFDADLFLWYGSAALQETLKIHKKIERIKF
jgi:uncharacterized protein YciI